jgi:hypothetical protein
LQALGWCEIADGATHFLWYKRSIIISAILGLLYVWMLLPYAFAINPVLFTVFYIVNYSLAIIVEPDLDQLGLTSSEGRAMRGSKRANILVGLLGAFWVMWWFLYAWFIGLVGGHRSLFSHGAIVGTIGRMVWFNLPIAAFLFGIKWYWGWSDWWYQLYMDVWLCPYLLSQLLAWILSDAVHLTLDTEWSKGILYTPTKGRNG